MKNFKYTFIKIKFDHDSTIYDHYVGYFHVRLGKVWHTFGGCTTDSKEGLIDDFKSAVEQLKNACNE